MNEQFIETLQSLATIRQRANQLLSLARQDKLAHFFIDEEKMAATADYVIAVMYDNYPNLAIPYHSRWRHFEAGGIKRINVFAAEHGEALGKILYELVIVSVLLDAGAGQKWHYRDQSTGQFYSRSEGLALASFDLYYQGAFSLNAQMPWRVDAEKLLGFTEPLLGQGLQVSATNPLTGLKGRVALLNRLGEVVQARMEGRLGNFYSDVTALAVNQCISSETLFHRVLTTFVDVWPNSLHLQGKALGDVWRHSALKGECLADEFVPFHKLSQWLTYSLIEPLEQAGFKVTDLDKLTALAEYRNGGLLIDTGLLRVKNEKILQEFHAVDAEVIVEWRALTVALIDELATLIRERLKLSANELPLVKILQGGTWEAGRRLAAQKRTLGIPPIQILSDGTIF